jgi:hypothetical protein
MSKTQEDAALIELSKRISELEARVKKLENWKLVHTSMIEEENAPRK